MDTMRYRCPRCEKWWEEPAEELEDFPLCTPCGQEIDAALLEAEIAQTEAEVA